MNYDIRKQLEELQKNYYLAIDEAFKAKTVLGEKIFEEMRQDLYDRYVIEREQLKKSAKILDKNIDYAIDLKIYELTPHNRGFLWLFKNEAKKLKIREVDVDNRIELDGRTADVEALEEKIYSTPEPDEKPKKLSFFKRLFNRKRDNRDNAPAAEQEKPESDAKPETAPNAQPSAPADNLHVARDAGHHNDNQEEKPAVNVIKPPTATPISEKPKPKAKPKKVSKPTAEPTAPTAPTAPAQLEGQIGIDELNGK